MKIFYCIGYLFVAILFLVEYLYYSYSIKHDLYHYRSRLMVHFTDSYITWFSGICVIALFFLMIIPIIALILKKKTLMSVLLTFFHLAAHGIAAIIVMMIIEQYDITMGGMFEYRDFCTFEQPGGDIVLCMQDTIPLMPGDIIEDGTTIYVEICRNTLKEVTNLDTFLSSEHTAEWFDDKVRITVTEVLSEREDREPRHEYIEVTYEELERIKRGD